MSGCAAVAVRLSLRSISTFEDNQLHALGDQFLIYGREALHQGT